MRTREVRIEASNYMEHRWGLRIPCSAEVRIAAAAGAAGTGRLRDVSTSGAFIATGVVLPLFAQVEIAVHIPGAASGVGPGTRANIVRFTPEGFAVEWCEIQAGTICDQLGCATRCPSARRSR